MARGLRLAWVCAVAATGASCAVMAAPEPERVVGSPTAGETLVVRGQGFGAQGPRIALFEDFESAPPGSAVRADHPLIGEWGGMSNSPRITAGGHSGSGALESYDGQTQRQVSLRFPEKHREIFISYWLRLPPGTRFPGQVSGPRQFSSDSSWKMTWLMDTGNGHSVHERFDFNPLAFAGGSGFMLFGNTFRPTNRFLPDHWWSWDHWMRVSTWVRNPLVKEPGGLFEVVSEDRGYYSRAFGAQEDRISYANQVFDVVAVPGWIKGGAGNQVRPLYDDVYVAVGPAAAARVELANAPRYENATRMELLLVQSWSDSEIEAQIPRATRLGDETWYVFVIDGEGRRSRSGVPLCTDCPLAPVVEVESRFPFD